MAGRRAKRIKPARKVTVSFMGPGVHFTGELADLSESGILIRCSKKLPLDTMGRLAIDMLPETFRTVAVLKRHVPGVGVALQFTQMTPQDRERLHRLILRLGKDIPT